MHDRWRDFRFGTFVICLPADLAESVAALRARFDPVSAAMAPPHIAVTQPLAETPNDIARADLGAVIAEFAPFDVTVGPARALAASTVVYLAVEPASTILSIRAAAHATGLFRIDLPHTDDFVPGVTVRESRGPRGDDADAVIGESDRLVPRSTFRCTAIDFLAPTADGRFGSVDRIELLGS